jgi:hypothetical protein
MMRDGSEIRRFLQPGKKSSCRLGQSINGKGRGFVIVMESSLARLGSGSSRNFLLLLEKLEPKNQHGLIGSTEKNSGLKSLNF